MGREIERRKIGNTSTIEKPEEQSSQVARLRVDPKEEGKVSKLRKENEALRCLVQNMEYMLRE